MKHAALIAVVLATAAAAAAGPLAPNPASPRKVMNEPAFEFAAPSSWTRRPSADGAVILIGPSDRDGLSPVISARHYPAGGKEFPDLRSFVARQTAPPLFETSPATETLGDVAVAGRKARRFARDSSEFVPPNSRDTKEIPMREEIVAIPGDAGFFVVVYRAPKTVFKKRRDALDRILSSFRPKK